MPMWHPSRAHPRRERYGGSRNKTAKPDQDPRQDPGAVVGSDLCDTGRQIPDRLHVREGTEEGPHEAGPPVVLPDGGGEGSARLRSDGRSYPREHVPQRPAAMDGVAEAVPEHHPVPGDLGSTRDAARGERGAEPRGSQRPGGPDDRRGAPLDDPDEP